MSCTHAATAFSLTCRHKLRCISVVIIVVAVIKTFLRSMQFSYNRQHVFPCFCSVAFSAQVNLLIETDELT
jgi:hypothetical protein